MTSFLISLGDDAASHPGALLKMLLQAELEEKRVEIHHARNIDYKAELQKQEQLIQGIADRHLDPYAAVAQVLDC